MSSFEVEIDEQSLVGSTFMARVANEIRRAANEEKATRKITQQAIADKIGTSRSVINREMSGLENLTVRRIAEILWALGWEPYFQARKLPDAPETNYFESKVVIPPKPTGAESTNAKAAKSLELATA